jgi:hypothetical protein
MRLTSEDDTDTSLRISRLKRLLFLRRKCLLPCFRLRSLPRPVILNRFAVALCVLIFGIVIILLLSLDYHRTRLRL